MSLLKNNVNYFLSIYVLFNKVYLCGGSSIVVKAANDIFRENDGWCDILTSNVIISIFTRR